MENKKTVLITGNEGFVGKNTQAYFEEQGYEVIGFDLPGRDLLDDNFSELRGIAGVIHIAAMKGIRQCEDDSVAAVENNILGTCRLLQACKNYLVKKFVYISTWAVNSPHKKMYDITKKTAEELVINYGIHKDMNTNIIRLATIYGPGMALGGAIAKFVENQNSGIPGIVHGDGEEIREFTFIDDIVSGIHTVYEKGEPGELYQVSTDEIISIKNLAEKICSSYEFGHIQQPKEPYVSINTTKLRTLGWEPKVSLDEGIRRMMDGN